MRIAVIGAGIIGVTTAYELALNGHEVIVYEQRGSTAAEGSFANAGLASPDYLGAWGAPGMPRPRTGWLPARHATLQTQGLSPRHWPWLWRWSRAGQPAVQRAGLNVVHRLAQFSQQRRHTLTRALKLDYELQRGQLILLRESRDQARLEAGLAWLTALGGRHELVSASRTHELEPALNPDTPLHAAIHLPGGEVANCRQFAQLLKRECLLLGVHFRFHEEVVAVQAGAQPRVLTRPHGGELDSQPDSVMALPGDMANLEPLAFDAVVVCAAMGSAALLAPLGLRLPLAAVHGHSVTAPLHLGESLTDRVPRHSVVDERHQITISRMGSRLRVSGGAELGDSAKGADSTTRAMLYKVLDDWFPGAALTSRAMEWKGSRVMLPDSLPLLGASGAPGVWVNLAHGASGWALACGSAKVLADQIGGRRQEIDVQGLGVERLR